jgi:hypothetical protein
VAFDSIIWGQFSMNLHVSLQNQDTFCIDTSALLHGWRRDYPPDVFGSVWANIADLADSGTLVAPEEVLLELERGGDDIRDWAKRHQCMFLPADEQVQDAVACIVNRWRSFLPDHSDDGVWADPYVIALASVKGATVVTGEKRVGPNAKRPRIPNICSDLGVSCTDLLGLLRTCGWEF